MVRTIYKLIGITWIIWSLGACTDAIDITQPGRLSADRAFQNVDDLELGLFGTYGTLDVTYAVNFNSTFTDEISIGFDNGGQGLGDGRYGQILNATSVAPMTLWVNNYTTINAATRLIVAATTITPESSEMARFNDIVGQAHAIRAFAYFQLYSYFTPDLQDDSALSVIKVDFVPEIDQELPRASAGEILGLINDDLDRAASLITPTSDVTRMGPDFVTALRARMAAYRGDYSTALVLANQLLDNYSLADQAEYFSMFNDDFDQTEVIFKIERTLGDVYNRQGTGPGAGGWIGSMYAFVDATITGSPYFEMSRSLFNHLDPEDIRFSTFVAPTSVIDPDYQNSSDFQSSDILVIQKYPGSEGRPLMNDLKIFRASEIALIKAEALAANGSLNGSEESAAAMLKQIRDVRFGSDQPLLEFANQAEAFGAIMDERRIELAFEGHRYLDLKRLGTRANRGLDRDPLDCAVNNTCTLDLGDHRWQSLPIPQIELDANSVIRDQQNPGY